MPEETTRLQKTTRLNELMNKATNRVLEKLDIDLADWLPVEEAQEYESLRKELSE